MTQYTIPELIAKLNELQSKYFYTIESNNGLYKLRATQNVKRPLEGFDEEWIMLSEQETIGLLHKKICEVGK